jgi:hypothetical protein
MACEHAFCIGCIRSWRQKIDGPADVDSVSHFSSQQSVLEQGVLACSLSPDAQKTCRGGWVACECVAVAACLPSLALGAVSEGQGAWLVTPA